MSSIAEWQQIREMMANVDRLQAALVGQADIMAAFETRIAEIEVRLDDMRAAIDGLKAALLARPVPIPAQPNHRSR